MMTMIMTAMVMTMMMTMIIIFLQVEFFNMYRVYMGEFKIAMKTLATYEAESREFKEVLTMLHQSPMCEKLSLASHLLASHLLTPIQRLPRYELLLKVSLGGA